MIKFQNRMKNESSISRSRSNSQNVTKRLQSELMSLMLNEIKGITAFPIDNDLFLWCASIIPEKGSIYEGYKFQLKLKFTEKYPYKAPKIFFTSPCFHPNVSNEGEICLDILKENWTPVYNVRTVMISIQQLLDDANTDSPLNIDAAKIWRLGKDVFKSQLVKYQPMNEISVTCQVDKNDDKVKEEE